MGVLAAAGSRAPRAMKTCRGVFERCSSARITCVISKSWSSTTLARWYRHVPSARWTTWSCSRAQSNSTSAADQVVEHQRPFAGHLQPHDGLAALGLEAGLRRPASRPSSGGCRRNGRFSRSAASRSAWISSVRGVVAVGMAAGQQLLDRRLVAVQPLRLVVRRVRPADLGPFVPVDAQPAEAVRGSAASASSTFRCWSVSSIRRMNCPPCCRANSQLNRAVRTPPMCR